MHGSYVVAPEKNPQTTSIARLHLRFSVCWNCQCSLRYVLVSGSFSPMRTRRPAAEQLHADELCRSRLENQIDLRHPLVQLSHRLPWSALEQALSPQLPATTGTGGRPALPMRLIAGLLYLKHAYDLSDEAVCARWLEKSVLAVLHRRGGVPDLRAVRSQLPDPLATASGRSRDGRAVGAHDQHRSHDEGGGCARVVAGDRGYHHAGKKAIAHPTDSRLLEVARKKLVLLAKRHGIVLRQTYVRQGPGLSRKAGRHAHARQFKRMRKVLRRQRTILGRVSRDLQRKLAQREPSVRERIGVWLARAHRLLTQRPKDKQKTLRLARAGSGMHEQGQGTQPLRMWRQGRHCGECAQGLDRGCAQFSRANSTPIRNAVEDLLGEDFEGRF